MALPLIMAVQVSAQSRSYVIGTRMDLVGGGIQDSDLEPIGAFFYEMYPSIEMKSSDENSTLTGSYTFGLRRHERDSGLDSSSHVASARFSRSAGAKWNFGLAESFTMTKDFETFRSNLGPLLATPASNAEFRFFFTPIAARRSSRINTVSVNAAYILNSHSTLSFMGSHNLLDYAGESVQEGTLSSQQRISHSITYTGRTNEHRAWAFQYAGAYLDFEEFEAASSHAFSAGFSIEISPTLTIQLAGGPTYVQSSRPNGGYLSHNASASLRSVTGRTTYSLSYTDTSGDASGLGSISDSRTVGFGMSRLFGNTTLSADISVFDSRGRIDNPHNIRGISSSVSAGFPLNRMWSLHWGGQYQRYDQTTFFGFDQKRIFISLRFSAPETWKVAP